jgi:predicted PurR-regulated permease PerM
MLAGVRSFLPLGLIVGVFNMIPYFGPLLGAIPALIMALPQGIGTVLLAALALFTVQQLDSMVISPRIMGALTGLHPGSVLLAITMGSSLGGIAGMLLAIPLTLAIRAIIRIWMAREAVD